MEDVVVGVNKYRRDEEERVDVLSIDNKAVREQQVARINKLKSERNQADVDAALEKLRTSARLTESTGKYGAPIATLEIYLLAFIY